MAESNSPEPLLRARVAIDQVMLSRLATQSAIERSRASLAEARSLLVALSFAVQIQSDTAGEAQRLMAALIKIQNDD
jgi:hypothetical protein